MQPFWVDEYNLQCRKVNLLLLNMSQIVAAYQIIKQFQRIFFQRKTVCGQQIQRASWNFIQLVCWIYFIACDIWVTVCWIARWSLVRLKDASWSMLRVKLGCSCCKMCQNWLVSLTLTEKAACYYVGWSCLVSVLLKNHCIKAVLPKPG